MMKHLFLASLFLSLPFSYSFGQQVPKDTLILFTRSPGYWGLQGESCPFYKLTIFADGKVELEPRDYREREVLYGKIIESWITQGRLKQLLSEFEKIDFYSLNSTFENKENSREDCPHYGSDAASATISVTANGKTKAVSHYHGCEGSRKLTKLTNLENKIDEAVNIKQWFDCNGGKNRITLQFKSNKD